MNNKNKIIKSSAISSAVAGVVTTGLLGVATLAALPAYADNGHKTKIVGGSESTPYSRPYQVALLMNGRQGCGGTLISSQWVLTAAHCLDSASTSNLTVKIGAHRMSGNDGQTHSVSQIIKHEYWQGAQNIQSGYDIAVLRLASPASDSITPAVLPSQSLGDQIAGVGTYVTVSGWGLTYNGSRNPSDVLREVALPVISNSSCSSQLGVNLGNGVICGGGPNGTSACNGDSGGPYAVQSGGNFYSIGTVSWGKGCSGATAFTRTTAYLDWIAGKTGVKPPTDEDQKPVARFESTVSELTATFSNNSTDDKGIQGSSWNFGDGNTSVQSSPSHTYAQAGSYTVTLTVTDTINQTDTLAKSVTVSTEPCTALTSPVSYPTWSASKSYVIGDRVSLNGTNYEATWWSTGATPTIYTNVWKVIDDGGTTCPPENEAPTAGFSVSTNDLAASFTNTSSDDKGVVSYSWTFGDGATSSVANPSHTYTADGSYSVSLTVADAEGLTHSTSQMVTVEEGGVIEGCDGLSAWSASTTYAIGDEVSHNGYKYEAIWWSTAADPEIFSNVWTNKGACSN